MTGDPPALDWTPHDDGYHGDLGPVNPNHPPPNLHNSYIGQTLYDDLNNIDSTQLAGRTIKGVPLEHINTFLEGYNGIKDAAEDIAVRHRFIWSNVSSALAQLRGTFEQAIAAAEQGLSGATAAQMSQLARNSLNYLDSLVDATERMSPLVDTFSRDIKETRDWFISNKTQLDNDTRIRAQYAHISEKQAADELLSASYDRAAQQTIHSFYNPPIDWISRRHPDMSAGAPRVGAPGGPGGTGTPSGAPPGGPSPGGLGTPNIPRPAGPSRVTPVANKLSSPNSSPNPLQGLGDAAKGVGDAANGAAQQAQNAAGQAGNAANQALGQALNNSGHKGSLGLPEGVLGLGPKGLTGAKTSGSGGGRSGGAGVAHGAASQRPAQLQPSSKPVAATQVSRAGVGAGGTPGAGAPAAGHRGGSGADKAHKANKALRLTKHGQDVIGEAEAVVPVVGGESKDASPPKSS